MALIKHAGNGGLCEVDEELAEKLLNDGSGQWVEYEAPAPKRTRRTKAQIEADKAAEERESDTEE